MTAQQLLQSTHAATAMGFPANTSLEDCQFRRQWHLAGSPAVPANCKIDIVRVYELTNLQMRVAQNKKQFVLNTAHFAIAG